MVSVVKRARKLSTLLAIRLGPGAAILPPEITKLHMAFAVKQERGHSGARAFWRTCLRRLKFHNPAIPMTVSRTTNQKSPATLSIHFRSPFLASSSQPAISSTATAQTSTAPVAASTSSAPMERIEVVKMRQKSESQILHRLMKLTNATAVQATEDEKEQFREMKEHRERAEADAKRQNAHLAKLQREKDIMDRARAMVDI